MRLSACFPLMSALLPAALFVAEVRGQAAAVPLPAAARAAVMTTMEPACRVELDVSHGSGFGQLLSTEGGTIAPAAQSLDLTIRNLDERTVVSIDATVHLLSGEQRFLPLAPRGTPGRRQLSMHIEKNIRAYQVLFLTWGVPDPSPVRSLEVDKVWYADGSSWTPERADSCRFRPNPLMLITER